MKWLDDAALARLRALASDGEAISGDSADSVDAVDPASDRFDAMDGRYQIEGELGRGGMGTVFLARDRALDREVALKVIADAAPDGAVERMRREARILARLEHPGIVPVHDVGTLPDGRVFYAMKRVRGDRLDAFASGRPAPELLRVFLRICEAVAFAHARGVVHRDLKPQNVMVGSFGEVLVLDWGIARLRHAADPSVSGSRSPDPDPPHPFDADPERTAHGTVMGTPGFMSPEQARGDIDAVDERADVYALGAILRFLLDRASPDGGAPRPLLAVAAKATADAPADRYAGVGELAAEVSRWLDGLSVAAYRESLPERARRLFVRYQTPILLVLAYLLMRVLLLVFRR